MTYGSPKGEGFTHPRWRDSKKYGKKVFESYLENQTPGAARMFWTYGPERGDITILALEPHPEPGEYGRVKLATEPVAAGSEEAPKHGKS